MSDMHFGRLVPPHRREAVAWYQPDVLWTAAREVVSSVDQLRNRDLREAYELPLTVIDRSDGAATGEFWFDFIADTGDGGNATYSVALAALKDHVAGEHHGALQRGELLLFGGDLAYPSASPDAYRLRFIEMFEGARHDMGASRSMVRGRQLTVAALAQNHDWMDSANTFNRYFTRNKNGAPFLGASIPQKQSYFCVKLPQGWWALGFDFALMHDIDRGQYEQFERLLRTGIDDTTGGAPIPHRIGPTDRVIVIYPEPYWTRPIGDNAPPTQPKRYQRLEGLLGDRIVLRLAGDLHHYMRWESPRHGRVVTCGTGGAFTHPTHTYTTTRPVALRKLDNTNAVPVETGESAVTVGLSEDKSDEAHVFERVERSVYPDKATSRYRAGENLWALFKRNRAGWGGNWGFAALLGVLYWFNAYLNSMPFTASFAADGFKPLWKYDPADYPLAFLLWLKAMTFSPLGFVINVLMIVACMLMGREAVDELSPRSSRMRRWLATWGLGFGHACLHVVAVFSLAFWLQQWVGPPLGGASAAVEALLAVGRAAVVGVGLIMGGAVAGAFIFGCYLTVMSRLGLLTNNGYSALGIEDYKGFLRFKVGATGRLDAYFIAIDRVPRHWTNAEGQWPAWVPEGGAAGERVHDHFAFAARDDGAAEPGRRTEGTESMPA